MKKIFLCLFTLLCLCFSNAFANDITSENLREECRIGPIGVTDGFDMGQLNKLFGHLTKPAHQHQMGVDHSLHVMNLTFTDACVTVLNDTIASLSVKKSRANTGEALGTPRGIVVGHDLDTVLRLYGQPSKVSHFPAGRRLDHDVDLYSYGTPSYGLSFTINSATNLVETIAIYVPTC
jgi:hypothetical protein